MIEIGLTGWGDHPSLYSTPELARNKLMSYSAHFPIVEVDSTFYAIQPKRNIEKWVKETPDRFGFIVKAYQVLTRHTQGQKNRSFKETIEAFKNSLQPMLQSGKLRAVLFQFPPWFQCVKPNVQLLRVLKQEMSDYPCALEFRHQSWFREEMRNKTLHFMRKEGWIHSICDQPQAGEGSVPIVLAATKKSLTIIRFHGRNAAGWVNRGQRNWREVRYLYRYSRDELLEWKERIEQLQKQTDRIVVLFNNNSGGDAADNAKLLAELLDVQFEGLAPRQLDWL